LINRIGWFVTSALLFAGATAASAQTPVDAGYRDFVFGATPGSTPTGEKPESKIWFNDGSWWGSLFSPAADQYRIHRFDSGSQSWTDTGTPLDTRVSSKADVLWDDAGQKLYVASHLFTALASGSATSASWGKLFRYSYDTSTRSYSLDAGFPVNVTRGRSETLTIAKDGNQRLFVTYVESAKVKINWSLTSDADWGTPVDLPHPTEDISVSSDDISAVVSFPNGNVGLMWSNQKTNKTLFTLHLPGDPPALWQPIEVVLPGGPCSGACADDHFSLRTDQSNRLFAALKTSLEDADATLAMLAVRDGGGWSRFTVGTYDQHLTRAVLALNEEQQVLYYVASNPESGGSIRIKSTSMNNISFEPGIGDALIFSSLDDRANNASTAKHSVTSATGLLVIASDPDTRRYLHAFAPLGAAVAEPPPAPANLVATAMSGSRIALVWNDASSNETQFAIERSAGAAPFELWNTVAANVTAVDDVTVQPSTPYSYRVRADNNHGASLFSNIASATTTAGGTAGNLKAITFEAGSLTDAVTGADAVSGSVTLESAQPLNGAYSVLVSGGSAFLE
jgi:hypothetical protein